MDVKISFARQLVELHIQRPDQGKCVEWEAHATKLNGGKIFDCKQA